MRPVQVLARGPLPQGRECSARVRGIAETGRGNAHRVQAAHPEIVVVRAVHLEPAAGAEKTATTSSEHERNISSRVAVAFAQFVAPDDDAVVEHGFAVFSDAGEFAQKIRVLLRVPLVDGDDFVHGDRVRISVV
jgi:hypothetical protein